MAARIPSIPALDGPSGLSQPGAVSQTVERDDATTGPDETERAKRETAKDEFLALARRRWQTINNSEAEYRQHQEEDLRFFASDQWPADIKAQRLRDGRPCLSINRLPGFVRQVTNEIREGRPGIEVIPVDNGADPALAEVYQGIIQHIESNSNSDVALSRATDGQVRAGKGWFRIVPEYASDNSFEQELAFKSIRNPRTVYADAASQELDGSDIRYLFIVEDVPQDEYDLTFGPESRSGLNDFARLGTSRSDWYPEGKVRVSEYYYLEPVQKTLVQFADGTVMDGALLERPEVQQSLQIRGIDPMPVAMRQVNGHQLCWALINGAEILDGNEDRTAGRVLPGSHIPVFPCYGEEIDIDGKTDYRGIIRDAIGAQQMSNVWRSAQTEAVALAPKSPYVAEAGQIEPYEEEWRTANTRNYSVLRYKAKAIDGHLIGPPQRNVAEPPIQAMSMLALQAENDLRATAGFSYDVGGQEHRPEQSGRAIIARQKQGEMGNSHFAAHVAITLRHAGRVLLELIPLYYSTPRVKRILGRDGQQRTVLIHAGNPEAAQAEAQAQTIAEQQIFDLSTGRYDVRVTAGVSFASQRQQDQDTMTQIMQSNPQMSSLLGDLLLGTMNSPIAKRAAARLQKALPPPLQDDAESKKPEIPPEVQQQMQEAQQMIDALTKRVEEQTDLLNSRYDEIASKERIAKMQAETTLAVAESKIVTEQSLALLDSRLRAIEQQAAVDIAHIQADAAAAKAAGTVPPPAHPAPELPPAGPMGPMDPGMGPMGPEAMPPQM
jgi:hypothetical protein